MDTQLRITKKSLQKLTGYKALSEKLFRKENISIADVTDTF